MRFKPLPRRECDRKKQHVQFDVERCIEYAKQVNLKGKKLLTPD